MEKAITQFTRIGNFICGTCWRGNIAKGDGVFNTVQFAMFTRDYALLAEGKRLLIRRRRWPVSLDEPNGVEHRNPKGVTRDPYVMFYCACVEMDRVEWIKEVKPPVFTPDGIIWRPNFVAFRRYLIDPTPRRKKHWERMERLSGFFSPGVPMFAIYLSCWKAWVGKSKPNQRRLRKLVPEWNLACRQLILHPDRGNDIAAIQSFAPRSGFLWQADPRREHDNKQHTNPQFLPLDESYYLDWDSLTYVFEQNNKRGLNRWS